MTINGHTTDASGMLQVEPFKLCLICGRPVGYGYGWVLVGDCGQHSFEEKIKILSERKQLLANEKN